MTDGQLTLTAVPAGDHAVMCYLPEPVRDDYPLILGSLAAIARQAGAIDVVPAYHSLLVICDSATIVPSAVVARLQAALPQAVQAAAQQGAQRLIRIPVCYQHEYAPDLPELAQQHGLTVAEVIAKHTEKCYSVACLGFIPGFAFLGYVDDAIATPRRANPRPHVAAGSVGIAGRQTGVYPADSPGGWNIIGRSPKILYDPDNGLTSCFDIGDSVQFYAISADEMTTWGQRDE